MNEVIETAKPEAGSEGDAEKTQSETVDEDKIENENADDEKVADESQDEKENAGENADQKETDELVGDNSSGDPISDLVDKVVKDIVAPLTTKQEITDAPVSEAQSNKTFIEKVELGVTYEHKNNNQVQVTFTKLPETPGSLSIEEVKLTKSQVEEFGLSSNIAYDITSDMENGSFAYDLKLPVPEGSEKISKVIYAENLDELADSNIGVVDDEKVEVVSDDSVVVSELNHFTIFVVVPSDIVTDRSIFNPNIQGWSTVKSGNANIGLASILDAGISNDFGSHVIKMDRAGGSGTNRAFLGYFESGLKLKDIEEVKWNVYSKQGNDTYLNIYLGKNPINVFGVKLYLETASVVFVPGTILNSWSEKSLTNATNIQVRHGSNPTFSSFADLINSQYGDWDIRVDNDAKAGITIVSGSSSPRAPQEHYVDGITLNIKGEEKFFNFVELYEQEESDSKFLSLVNYVQRDGKHSSHMLAGIVKVPADTQEVRFTFEGVDNSVVKTIDAYEHTQNNQWPNNKGEKNFRVEANLPEGEYSSKAEYLLNGNWHDVPGVAKVYSLDAPTMDIQYPNPSKNIFRSSDDTIVRLKVSDKYESFREASFEIDGTTYVVKRDTPGVDLRQAGNYVLVDITKAPNWNGLSEGKYVAKVNAKNKANDRAQNLAIDTIEFTIDNTAPVVTDFIAPELVSGTKAGDSKFNVSAKATDASGIESVKFYIAELPSDGKPKNDLPAIREFFGVLGANDVYTAELDGSGLDGKYVVLVSAKDNASHNSTPLFKAITIDNIAPVGVATYEGGLVFGDIIYINSIDDLSFTEEVEDNGGVVRATYLVQKYNEMANGFEGFCGNWNAKSLGSHALGGSDKETQTITNIKNCSGDITRWTNGTYKIFHAAYDNAGNEGKFNKDRQVFVIDKEAPDVQITSLSNGDTVKGVIEIRGTVKDDNLLRYYYNVAGKSKTVTTDEELEDEVFFEWDTTKLTDGEYTIVLSARDKSDNKDSGSTSTIKVTVDNTAPLPPVNLGWITSSEGLNIPNGGSTSEQYGSIFWEDVNTEIVSYSFYAWHDDVDSPLYGDESSPVNVLNDITGNIFDGGDLAFGEGLYGACLTAVDEAGNESECSEPFEITYEIDTPPTTPTTTPSFVATDNDNDSRRGRSGGSRIAVPAGLSSSAGSVLGASTGLGESCEMYLKTYMKEGGANDPAEVSLLQTFLETQGFFVMPTGVAKGFFGPLTKNAVSAFQNKYADEILTPWGITEATGNVFKSTRWKINDINCPGSEDFPLIP